MTDYGTYNPSNFRYLTNEILDAGAGVAILGGITTRLKAAATIKFGQMVQATATLGEVNVSTGTLGLSLGIAVGGTNTANLVLTDSALVDVTAVADAGEEILVQRSGVSYAILDTDDVLIGSLVKASAITAGRVGLGIDTAGAIPYFVGVSQTTSTVAGTAIVVLLKGLI